MPLTPAPPAVAPIDSSFAREISGVRLWEPPLPAAVRALAEAWSEHGVLVFRRQALSEAELITFSAAFGKVEAHVRSDWSSSDPRITLITNLKGPSGENLGGLGTGELKWHTDQSYVADPATGCLLYCVERPEAGGETWWANLSLAYAALPAPTKAAIEDKVAVFSYAERVSGYDPGNEPPPEIRARTPDVRHPLVNRHPVTGRPSLYLDPGTMTGVVGMSEAAGRALLEDLTAHATQPEFVYRHRWQVGDVVMWDNGFLLHRRTHFDPQASRLMKRTILRLSRDRHIVPPVR